MEDLTMRYDLTLRSTVELAHGVPGEAIAKIVDEALRAHGIDPLRGVGFKLVPVGTTRGTYQAWDEEEMHSVKEADVWKDAVG